MIPHVSGDGPEISPALLAFNIDPKQAAAMLGTTDEALNHRRVRRTGPSYSKEGSRIRYSYAGLAAYAKANGIELRDGEFLSGTFAMPERNDALAALPAAGVLN